MISLEFIEQFLKFLTDFSRHSDRRVHINISSLLFLNWRWTLIHFISKGLRYRFEFRFLARRRWLNRNEIAPFYRKQNRYHRDTLRTFVRIVVLTRLPFNLICNKGRTETALRAALINNASCDRPCLFASYRRRWQRYEDVIDHCPPAWAKHNRSYCERYPHRVCHSAGSALHHAVPNFRMPSARATKKDHRTVERIRISTATGDWV